MATEKPAVKQWAKRTPKRSCVICKDTRVASIDADLIGLRSLPRVLAKYPDLAHDTLASHQKRCIPAQLALVRANAETEVAPFETVQEALRQLIEEAEKIRRHATREGDYKIALAAIKEARNCLQIVGEITGELSAPPPPATFRPLFVFEDGARCAVNMHREPHTLAPCAKPPELPAAISNEAVEVEKVATVKETDKEPIAK